MGLCKIWLSQFQAWERETLEVLIFLWAGNLDKNDCILDISWHVYHVYDYGLAGDKLNMECLSRSSSDSSQSKEILIFLKKCKRFPVSTVLKDKKNCDQN